MDAILKFFTQFNYKKGILLLTSPILAMWQDYRVMTAGLLVIMFVDLYTGIKVYCTKNNVKLSIFKIKSWGHIKSGGLRRTLSKLKDYLLVIIAFHFFETYVLKSPLDIFGYKGTELIFVTLAVIELWSIGENFKAKRGYNIFEYMKRLLINRDIDGVARTITGEPEPEYKHDYSYEPDYDFEPDYDYEHSQQTKRGGYGR